MIEPIRRDAEGRVHMLDQRRLPHEEVWHVYATASEVAAGIRDMVIRGAPAIGVAAAMGLAIGARALAAQATDGDWQAGWDRLTREMAATRPTAVNLFWAIDRMRRLVAGWRGDRADLLDALDVEAERIRAEDVGTCRAIGEHGAALIPEGARILTHCNTGGLATAGWGTALGVIRSAHAAGKHVRVFADETRPYLQGSRLTVWECLKDGIDVTLIADSAAGYLMRRGEIDLAIVGADRIAANGDTANKIGTYQVAALCHRHDLPFYVAAPLSTIDLKTATGEAIEIEERGADEVRGVFGHLVAPADVPVRNPAFDVTPAELVTAIITEAGVARPSYVDSLAALFGPIAPSSTPRDTRA